MREAGIGINRLEPGLYITATPVGNARDISLRALDVLAGVDAVLCEDSRVTRKLLAIHGVSARLVPYHDHNAPAMRPKIAERISRQESLALVCDAGMPLISDPGYKLVRYLQQEGHRVTVVPGASSILAGLVLSGLPPDRFFFAGFLPSRPGSRQTTIESLRPVPGSLVIFESPRRLCETLEDLARILGPRDAAITRELTKKFEEVDQAPLNVLAARYSKAPPPRGEIVIVIGPAQETGEDPDLDALLKTALARHSLKEAAEMVSVASGHRRRDVYRRALHIAGQPSFPAENHD